MNPENDSEELARRNLAVYYTAIEMLTSSGVVKANTVSRLVDEAVWCDGGLSYFDDANAMAAELNVRGANRRLTRNGTRIINRLIRLAKQLRRSRHVVVGDWGYLILAGSDGIVPRFLEGKDWTMIEPEDRNSSAPAIAPTQPRPADSDLHA